MTEEDKVQVGLSEEARSLLQAMKDDGVISQLQDGYRLGIALAIARDKAVDNASGFHTMFSVSSVDPDGAMRNVVIELYPNEKSKPAAYLERLADYGVREIGQAHRDGLFRVTDLLDERRTHPGTGHDRGA